MAYVYKHFMSDPLIQEGETFEKLFAYAEKHDLKAIHKEFHHREIYVSDFRKTAAEKLKTISPNFCGEGTRKMKKTDWSQPLRND